MPQTVKQVMALSPLPLLETRMIMEHVLQVPRAWLFSHDTDALTQAQVQAIEALYARRAQGEPMAYLLGYREFMGLNFMVNPHVLIPRPDTETLVEQALQSIEQLQNSGQSLLVLDVGTGSGAIALAIKYYAPKTRVTALDISTVALAVARANAKLLNLEVNFMQSDVLDALQCLEDEHERAGFNLIVSNPPYIAARDPHLQKGDLRFEPSLALTDQADGLEIIRKLVCQAKEHLAPQGQLWLEHGWDQAPAVRALLQAQGFVAVSSKKDLAGIERISGGTRP